MNFKTGIEKLKRFRIAAIAGLVLALVACSLWITIDPTPDPVHAGKHASEWLFELGCGNPVRERQATNAFTALGTNALPFLKATLNRRDSRLRQLVLDLQRNFPRLGLHWHSPSARLRAQGLIAATALGINAQPILPEAIEAIMDWRIGGDEYAHVTFLAGFGRAGLVPLAVGLTNGGTVHGERTLLESLNLILASNQLSGTEQELVISTLTHVLQANWDEFVDREAAQGLGWFGAKSERAIPVLLDCLTNREPKSSCAAARALGRINRRPEIVLPALIQATAKERFWMVRIAAIQALVDTSTNAANLKPALLKLASDKDEVVRLTALEILLRVAPAANVGIERRPISPAELLQGRARFR